ncbi:hypothetical protein E4Q23_18230 [Candidatus Accumulibacter phosphatis]|jgi:hypothetical protein|uniref:Prevent host death protein, Phd antitoxin n=1 Tax=Candidatus Accumulibacter phosphatis TaxID=327160 RepID=A0ABX1TZ20_9PROT|nr:hypothetical protein [Candidatus Accumulibacter phosphatis]NMQ29534.1 hypothetical protein [Candidatus Accumulibacter phosphatis]
MQAIELETTISVQGSILLPPDCQAFYGRHARMILLLDDETPTPAPQTQRTERQAAMRQALDAVAQAGMFAHIDDAADWQREQRAEPTQPGRED